MLYRSLHLLALLPLALTLVGAITTARAAIVQTSEEAEGLKGTTVFSSVKASI